MKNAQASKSRLVNGACWETRTSLTGDKGGCNYRVNRLAERTASRPSGSIDATKSRGLPDLPRRSVPDRRLPTECKITNVRAAHATAWPSIMIEI